MKIKWNKVTWYSRWGAIILFIILLPILTFYIGRRYEETLQILNAEPLQFSVVKASPQHSETIDESIHPVESFIAAHQLSLQDHVYKLEVDLNGDKYNDLLLSSSKSNFDNARSGLIWSVYLNNQNKNYYHPFVKDSMKDQSSVMVHPGAMGYVTMPGETKKSLVTYWRNDNESGSITGYTVVNDRIVEKDYGVIYPLTKDTARYLHLFSNGFDPKSALKIQDVMVSEIVK